MGKVFFGTLEGENLGSIETISELELTVGDVDDNFIINRSEEMAFDCRIDDYEQFEKQVVYGGDRGRYNGHILERDGYLSPKNGWIK